MNTTIEPKPKASGARSRAHTDMSFIGCRIKTSLRDAMLKWSEDHDLDLSFVLRRCLEIGWPHFLENNFLGLQSRPKKEYLS